MVGELYSCGAGAGGSCVSALFSLVVDLKLLRKVNPLKKQSPVSLGVRLAGTTFPPPPPSLLSLLLRGLRQGRLASGSSLPPLPACSPTVRAGEVRAGEVPGSAQR